MIFKEVIVLPFIAGAVSIPIRRLSRGMKEE